MLELKKWHGPVSGGTTVEKTVPLDEAFEPLISTVVRLTRKVLIFLKWTYPCYGADSRNPPCSHAVCESKLQAWSSSILHR